jgi:hypothetical protein
METSSIVRRLVESHKDMGSDQITLGRLRAYPNSGKVELRIKIDRAG